MKGVEQFLIRMNHAGQVDRLVEMEAKARRLEAEPWLEREKTSRM
jgi:hypothetical protein